MPLILVANTSLGIALQRICGSMGFAAGWVTLRWLQLLEKPHDHGMATPSHPEIVALLFGAMCGHYSE